jgi:hypothetical protein
MGEYEIGRDLQELRSRIERLEAPLSAGQGLLSSRSLGRVAATVQAEVHNQGHPILWKHDAAMSLPAFVHGFLGLAPAPVTFDTAESKTWPGSPNPTILFVNWNGGGTDEYFRLNNPVFSLIRYSTPTEEVGLASYQAWLVASGKARHDPTVITVSETEQIHINMTNSTGGIIWSYSDYILVQCNDNRQLLVQQRFPPSLYDIIVGANWYFTGERVIRC